MLNTYIQNFITKLKKKKKTLKLQQSIMLTKEKYLLFFFINLQKIKYLVQKKNLRSSIKRKITQKSSFMLNHI